MRKFLFFIINILLCNVLFAQVVEKIVETDKLFTIVNDDEYEGGKALGIIYVSDLESKLNITHPYLGKKYEILDKKITTGNCEYLNFYGKFFKIGNFIYYISSRDVYLHEIEKGYICSVKSSSGVCFVLRKDKGYIFFFVDLNNKPSAFDTNGKIYNSLETMNYLREYDKEEYARSYEYAKENGILGLFEVNEALVWNDTYYASSKVYNKLYESDKWLFPSSYEPICYDLGGIAYQNDGLDSWSPKMNYFVVVKNGKWLIDPINMNSYSNVLSSHLKNNETDVTSNSYIGLSGNIYFYISDETETEVFRIRNTWDSTNLYALAINGYTEDFYGDYVKEVLPKMSKADLRLLRNTVFALYGVHFKSEDLAKYFDKQVWYTDEGKSSGEISLPENRQKLVEMILELEK